MAERWVGNHRDQNSATIQRCADAHRQHSEIGHTVMQPFLHCRINFSLFSSISRLVWTQAGNREVGRTELSADEVLRQDD